MVKRSNVYLAVLSALLIFVPVLEAEVVTLEPGSAEPSSTVTWTTDQHLSNSDLARAQGGLGGLDTGECAVMMATASATAKVFGGWLSIGNPVAGLIVVGIGVALAAAPAVVC